MEDNYPKSYKEVLEILKYLPKESIDKIPEDMIETFKMKMDQNYEFFVDINKSFEEQELLEETKAILANIFRDYWATSYLKERIIAKEKYDRQKEEKLKKERYNTDNIFKKSGIIASSEEQQIEKIDNLPIEVKKEKFYERLINFIKRLFDF